MIELEDDTRTKGGAAPLDILQDGGVDLDETVQAAPEHHNIEELLAASAPVMEQSDTIAALKDLDLGGKTQEEAEAD